MFYRAYTIEALEKVRIGKGDLAVLMGINNWEGTYDYALPQQWLDDFVYRTKLPYNLALSTTFWFYSREHGFGFPVSGCVEVAIHLPAVPKAIRINEMEV